MSLIKKKEHEVQRVTRTEVTAASHVAQDANAYTLRVELPGVDEGDIELALENRVLSLTAENNVAPVREHALVLSEIPEVRYRAAFDLPEHVEASALSASLRNGMLTVKLPKREEVKPRRIAISVD